jgi:protein tyrosine/serine phosphatase
LATSEDGAAALHTILTFIHDNPGCKTLIHCSLGKDRTGIVFAVLLALAGVPDTVIGNDYADSEIGLQAAKPQLLDILLQQRPGMPVQNAQSYVDNVIAARPECISLMLDKIRKGYGSIDGYIVNVCGISYCAVESLRRVLVQPA